MSIAGKQNFDWVMKEQYSEHQASTLASLMDLVVHPIKLLISLLQEQWVCSQNPSYTKYASERH